MNLNSNFYLIQKPKSWTSQDLCTKFKKTYKFKKVLINHYDFYRLEKEEELIAEADIISLHIPKTEKTENIIDSKKIKLRCRSSSKNF